MLGEKRYIAVLIAVFALQACGKLDSAEVARNDPHPSRFDRMQVSHPGIEGDWESACEVEFAENGDYLKTSLSLHQGLVTKTLRIYRDSNCQLNAIWDRVYSGQYTLVGDELKQQYFTMTIVSKNVLQTSILNLGADKEDRYCKAEDPFKLNEPVSFSPISDCNEELEQSSKLDLRGSKGNSRELFFNNVRLIRVLGE